MEERRKEQRWPAYLGATAIFNKLISANCIVKNTSSAGARLVLHNTPLIPDEFDVVVPRKNAEWRARVKWRRLEQIGVELAVRQTAEAPVSLEEARRLRHLKKQNAALRRRLSVLEDGE